MYTWDNTIEQKTFAKAVLLKREERKHLQLFQSFDAVDPDYIV